MGEDLMTPTQLAELLAIPEGTLPQWRYLRRGPRYIKIGRHIRYRRSDVEQWLEEQASTPRPAA